MGATFISSNIMYQYKQTPNSSYVQKASAVQVYFSR